MASSNKQKNDFNNSKENDNQQSDNRNKNDENNTEIVKPKIEKYITLEQAEELREALEDIITKRINKL